MTETSPGARAVSALEIIDVFMVESNCHVARDFNQTEMMPRITFQHRLSPEREGIAQVRTAVTTAPVQVSLSQRSFVMLSPMVRRTD